MRRAGVTLGHVRPINNRSCSLPYHARLWFSSQSAKGSAHMCIRCSDEACDVLSRALGFATAQPPHEELERLTLNGTHDAGDEERLDEQPPNEGYGDRTLVRADPGEIPVERIADTCERQPNFHNEPRYVLPVVVSAST